ncbi:hypothetical protein [Streptomyces sp. NPDC001970]
MGPQVDAGAGGRARPQRIAARQPREQEHERVHRGERSAGAQRDAPQAGGRPLPVLPESGNSRRSAKRPQAAIPTTHVHCTGTSTPTVSIVVPLSYT